MVGFRVFDVGLLIVWLVWFFRLRDDDDRPDDDGPGGGGPEPDPENDPGGGGLGKPLGRLGQGGWRNRDHRSRAAAAAAARRGAFHAAGALARQTAANSPCRRTGEPPAS